MWVAYARTGCRRFDNPRLSNRICASSLSLSRPPAPGGDNRRNMPWQSAPPLAIITVAMGAVSGLMSVTNYLTVGRTDRLIGLDDFDYM